MKCFSHTDMDGKCSAAIVQKWTVSIFTESEEIDCSEIAKKHGGGGHKKAAGFVCTELPFKKS